MPKLNLSKKPKVIKEDKQTNTGNKKDTNKVNVFNVISCVVVALSHVLIIVAIILGFRYINIYPSLIGSIIGIVMCIVVMIDIVYFIGYKHKDLSMKIVSFVLAFLILITSTVGSYYLAKTNTAIDKVIGNTTANDSKFETISGVFVIRTNDAKEITDISKLNKKIVGYVSESETGVATIGMQILDEANIDYAPIAYQTYDEMIIDISDGKIDAGIFLDGYRGLYNRNKEEGGSDFTGIIAEFTDLEPFSKDVEITANASNKDISKDPFNILLIGYSRTDIGSPVGLADAIIVASVNPKTYTVSMMSIARDSYVPISCYGGTKDKINSARGTSRACFIKTVEDYTGMDMDFYMEADYEAVVAVVDAIEGITITNPVDFTLDGIFVPAGTYTAWGWEVLQFCRERHHMPNGDFDRQQHQKEVIIAIAEKLIKKADITLFLNAIDAAGDKFSTNLTLSQLTGMFNMVLQTKNYTGMKVSKLIDFHQLRLTGYADWYYNEAMSLPLWIYKIYQGSYNESIDHAKFVLGEKVDSKDQIYSFEFDTNEGYLRPLFYSLEYDEEQIHEEMPAYYPNFVGMSYDEAVQYCKDKGIVVNWNYISPGESGYNEDLDGYIVSQSLRYGIKVSAGTNTLTVMGDGNFKIKFPDWDDMTLEDAKDWCNERDYDYHGHLVAKVTEEKSLANKVANMKQLDGKVVEITYYVLGAKMPDLTGKTQKELGTSKTIGGITLTFEYKQGDVGTTADSGKVYKQSIEAGSEITENKTVTLTCYACNHVWDDGKVTTEATCGTKGVKTLTCKTCGTTKTEEIPATGKHDFEDVAEKAATCTEDGHAAGKKCKKCGALEGAAVITALGHDYVKLDSSKEPTCTEAGRYDYKCSRCDSTKSEEKAALDHDWNEGSITTEPTVESEGVKTYTCNRDSSHTKTEPINKLESTPAEEGENK